MRIDGDRLFMTQVDDHTVVLDSTDSSYLTVNPAGTVLMEALETGATITTLVHLLVRAFDVSPETARRDCDAFVKQLEARGWLITDDAVTPARPASGEDASDDIDC